MHQPISFEILRNNRFFEPIVIGFLQNASQPNRSRSIIGMISVGHKMNRIPQGSAKRASHSPVVLQAKPQLDLHCLEACSDIARCFLAQHSFLPGQAILPVEARRVGLYSCPETAAKQLIDWNTGGLPFDVPQGDVDTAEGFDWNSF